MEDRIDRGRPSHSVESMRVTVGAWPVTSITPIRQPASMDTPRERVGARALWGESLHILISYSAPILCIAIFGLAGASLLGALFNIAILPGLFRNAGARAFGTVPPGTVNPQLVVQSIAGTVGFILARGAITWIALHAHDEKRPTIRAALRAALKCWPELLAQSLVYSIIITLGVVTLTLLLRELHLDVTNIGRVTSGLGDMSRAVGIRALGAFIPDPGSPFSELYSFVRSTLARTAYYYWYVDRGGLPSTDLRVWAVGLAGVLLMVVIETIFRLRTVLVMRDQSGSMGYAGIVVSMRAGWRNFGFITLHIWLLRLAMVLIAVAFTAVPTTFAQSLIVPAVARFTSSFWPYPLSSSLFTLSGALVGVVPAAFALIFDTQLLARLPRPIR